MTINRLISFCLIILILGGCGSTMRTSPTHREPVASEPRQETTKQKSTRVQSQPKYSLPVAALLNTASRQEAKRDFAAAAGSVERALRIEPGNAYLWNKLAVLRFEQGRYAMAAELAAKSNSLAAGNTNLLGDNWKLIARAHRQTGKLAAAKEAERKSRVYR